jgi:hypothetical protein
VTLLESIRNRLGMSATWPPAAHVRTWEEIEFYAALRTSNEEALKLQANIPWWRKYMISPVPRVLSRASANLLYGEPAEYRAAKESDQGALDRIITENLLDAEAHRMAVIASSEGETWGRIIVDPKLLDVPIIEFVSRRQVIPHFQGRFVVAATFISEWEESANVVFRLLETYEAGAVQAQLFQGSRTSLGDEVTLDSYARTAGKSPTVLTGIDRPLCAFIPNSIDADPTRGYADYRGLEERFLGLNESATIGQENMRLSGKKRALLDAKYLRNGKLPAGDDVFIRSEAEGNLGEAGKPLQMLEYTFEAEQLVKYLDHMIDTTLFLGGTAPAAVGRSIDGGAVSGTALKLKMAHSLIEAAGKGRYSDNGLRRLLRFAAIIDARSTVDGGFGRRREWTAPDEDPTVVRGDGLPQDDMEAAKWVALAAGAEAVSTEEKVRYLHPDWNEQQVADEVKLIEEAAPEPPTIATPPGSPDLGLPPGEPTPPVPAPAPAGE